MVSTRWIWLSRIGLAVFALVVATQPLLVPSYDPLRQEVSEYVHTSAGPLMLVGFLAWSISLSALGVLIAFGRSADPRWLRSAQLVALFGAAASVVVLTCFATDRGTRLPGVVTRATTAGAIHDLASTVATLGIVVAALCGAGVTRGWLRWAALMLLLAGLASSVTLLAIGDPLPGLRQRVLIAAACLWQAAWLVALGREARSTWPRSSAGSRCSTS